MTRRLTACLVCLVGLVLQTGFAAFGPPAPTPNPFSQDDLKQWLTYIASD